ncbi:hypothetical protein KCU98_g9282, partial [Aureobasidium melanogenum]
MATKHNPEKDISFLLAVVHNLTITSDYVNRAIANWPTDLCSAPAGGEDLGRRLDEIWQKWTGNEIAAASVAAEKKLDGTSSSKAIIIDDSDDEIEKPITPISPRILPCKFRIPPAASLVTPLGVEKVVVTPKIEHNNSKIVVNLGESDHEESTPAMNRACPTTKNNPGLLTPQSLEKEVTANLKAMKPTNKAKKTINACSIKAKKRPVNNDSEAESDDDIPTGPPTIGSTRKRRAIDYYKALFNDQVVDNSDDDYQYEEIDNDRRLNEKYDSLCPVLATPSKRQKKARS